MSLRIFHIFFITISTLLCVGTAWWCFANHVQTRYGAMFGAGAVVMPIYGVWFLKKIRKLPA